MNAHARWSVLAVASLLALLSAAPGAQSAADYQALRKEMDLLRERLVALQKEVDALRAARSTAAPPAPAPSIVSVDNVILNLAKAPMRGSAAAKLVMAEVSDFECPFCGRYSRETLPQLVKQYVETGKVRYAFVHLPIATHRFAFKASEAAACAADQGKFWEMHDLLFSRQADLAPAFLAGKGPMLGLDQAAYTGCLDSARHAPAIKADIDMVQKFGIRGTPTFFLGTMDPKTRVLKAARRIVGAKPLATFQQVLDEMLAKAEPGAQP